MDLEFGAPQTRGPVEYRFGNMECPGLPDAFVGFAASLSVVEHGVDLARFFAEMERVLLPGGLLFVSTDHWGPGMDTAGVEACGAPFRPFDAADIAAAVETARACGLRPTGPVGTEAVERAVHWRRMDLRYTFHNLLFPQAAGLTAPYSAKPFNTA